MYQYYSEHGSGPVPPFPFLTTRSHPTGMRMDFGKTARLIYEDQIEKTKGKERKYPLYLFLDDRHPPLFFFAPHSFFS